MDIAHLLKRHDHFLDRVNRMLDAHERGAAFPVGTKFREEELESIDTQCHAALEIISSAVPDEREYIAPYRYAYKFGYAKPGPVTWLQSLKCGLVRSKDYLKAHSQPEMHSDNPSAKDTGAITTAHVVVERGATAGNIVVTGGSSIRISSSPLDLGRIVDELSRLHSAAGPTVGIDATAASNADSARISAAREAAQRGDVEGVASNLKGLSPWAMRLAEKIGAPMIVEFLKTLVGS